MIWLCEDAAATDMDSAINTRLYIIFTRCGSMKPAEAFNFSRPRRLVEIWTLILGQLSRIKVTTHVTPTEVGVQVSNWIPAKAGMTNLSSYE